MSGTRKGEAVSAREALRQRLELEEKRKYGLAPLATDSVTKEEISTNVPYAMTQAPWYYGIEGSTLVHHRKDPAPEGDSNTVLVDRLPAVEVVGQAQAFEPGACQNCGSRTHKTPQCTQPRRRVGAHYTGRVTGVDRVAREAGSVTYSQKRDRYAGHTGVELTAETAEGGAEKRRKGEEQQQEGEGKELAGAFAALTAQHGGVEIKELPKYLQNLDAEGVFYDPKTGSMRGNPNEQDPTRLFQGDLQRYRTGDYYDAVESQLRFLRGETKSFVDFGSAGEETIVAAKETHEGKERDAESLVQETIVETLYGRESAPASRPAQPQPEKSKAVATTLAAVVAAAAPAESALQRAQFEMAYATRAGHAQVYGSYFDPATFTWGYRCCEGLGVDAPPCA